MKTLLHPIHSLSQTLHDSSDVVFGGKILGNTHDLLSTQLQEEGNSFMVSVPVPGMNKEDLSVYTEGRVLLISTKGQAKLPEKKGGSKRRDFTHAFVLPDGIDTNRIHAKCRHGLLTITIEKIKSKKRHVVIKVGGNEKDIRNTMPFGAWWDRIKEKVYLQRFIPKKGLIKSSIN
ncbi:hypothetical protein WSM22_23040 [Cytophagales bacterium WSM2-2]|nr:hypothetical protein WSM22_23040 [Cytophagales bacterium WSM2-2]